jgi:hypothetical protein
MTTFTPMPGERPGGGYADAMTDGQRDDGAAPESRRAEESETASAEGRARPASGRDDVVREDEQRLRDLDDEIRHAKALAEDVIGKPEPSFADGGTVDPEDDDPTLAPPG